MPVNPVFTHYGAQNEQGLLDDLVIESIQVSGQDMLYMPRKIFDENLTFTEDPQSYFNEAIPIEMYIQNVENFKGDGEFLSKFGLEIRDRVILVVSKTRFMTLIGDPQAITRPHEGDLIFFPLNKKIFEIRYVEPFSQFFPLGTNYVYQLTCELYEYSAEKFTTGVADIDILEMQYSEDLLDFAISNEGNTPILTESGDVWVVDDYVDANMDDTADITTRADQSVDFTEVNPYGMPRS